MWPRVKFLTVFDDFGVHFAKMSQKYQEFIRVYNDLFVMFPASQNSYIPNAFPRSAGIANPHHGTVKILMLFLIILVSFH